MVSSWWWLWVVFMFLILLPPMGYGWGYRGWGPPYPRFIQRRRATRAAASGSSAQFDHHAWGWGGDLIWLGSFIWMIWMLFIIVGFWWR